MTRAHPLKRLLDRQIRALRGNLARAATGDVEPLHRSRVATRRLREMLPLCAAGGKLAGSRQARRHLRRIGAALGDVREIDVALQVLDEIQTTRPTAVGRLREHLRGMRVAARSDMRGRLDGVGTRKLDRRLAEIDQQLRHARDREAWIRGLGLRIARRTKRVERAIDAAGAVYAPERVHAVRIAVKKLRYAIEFAHHTGQARVARSIRVLRGIQDTLGRLHDLEVLQALAGELSAMPAPDAAWVAELEGLRHDLERQCRQLHGRYIRRRAALVEACGVAQSVSATLVIPARGRDTPSRVLKMSLVGPARQVRRTASGRT